MEQITRYFEHMDVVSFGIIAVPCVMVSIYGILQLVNNLTNGKNDNMERAYNNTNNNGGKSCRLKLINGNVAASPANPSTVATRTTENNNGNNNHNNHNNNHNKINTRKTRYNNKRQDRFANSSCLEDKFLGQHNPEHRNSTSSEATSEDINSGDERMNKAKGRSGRNRNNNQNNGGSNGNKTHVKRQQKPQSLMNTQEQVQLPLPKLLKSEAQTEAVEQVQVNLEVEEQSSKANNKCQQGKPRSNNGNSNNNNSNQKRSKVKQTKCNMSSSNNAANSNIISKTNNNKNSSNKKTNSKVSFCIGQSNSSSAVSSPTSSPNSSSSGNSSANSRANSSGSNNISSNINHAIMSTSHNWQRVDRHMHIVQSQRYQNENFLVEPLWRYHRLKIDDYVLQKRLLKYKIEPHLLRVYGFPVDSVTRDGAIEFFKCVPNMNISVIKEKETKVINSHDGLNTCGSNPNIALSDSGNISPHSLESESGGDWSGSEYEPAEVYCRYNLQGPSLAKQCCRCKREFLVDEWSGQYLSQEECIYHWGKYHRIYIDGVWRHRWTCCMGSEEDSTGCTHHDLHVWSGSVIGVNGPYYDFVRTKQRYYTPQQRHRAPPAIYALDCEMCYTGRGLEVTKISLVALNGQLVYEHFVRPDAVVIDFNTRYSGVTAKDLKSDNVKTLDEVQRDLLELIDAETILIGHALDNDLRALRIVHKTLIDTSISFPHDNGFPYRRALKSIIKLHLDRDIQSGEGSTGHSSFEDSRACMDLMLWRVNIDFDCNGTWVD